MKLEITGIKEVKEVDMTFAVKLSGVDEINEFRNDIANTMRMIDEWEVQSGKRPEISRREELIEKNKIFAMLALMQEKVGKIMQRVAGYEKEEI